MTFSALVFAWRKAATTPAQFREHYENVHVPLIKEVAGDSFPLTHTRHYIARSDDAASGYPASVVIGTPQDFEYDSFAEIVFESQEHFGRFMAAISQPENARKLEEDEAKFLDKQKMRAVFVGETNVTTR